MPDLNYVGLWHNPDIRLGAPEGLVTSGLPTLGVEGRLSAYLQFCTGWAWLPLRLRVPLRVSVSQYQQDGSLTEGYPCSGAPDHLKHRDALQRPLFLPVRANSTAFLTEVGGGTPPPPGARL